MQTNGKHRKQKFLGRQLDRSLWKIILDVFILLVFLTFVVMTIVMISRDGSTKNKNQTQKEEKTWRDYSPNISTTPPSSPPIVLDQQDLQEVKWKRELTQPTHTSQSSSKRKLLKESTQKNITKESVTLTKPLTELKRIEQGLDVPSTSFQTPSSVIVSDQLKPQEELNTPDIVGSITEEPIEESSCHDRGKHLGKEKNG